VQQTQQATPSDIRILNAAGTKRWDQLGAAAGAVYVVLSLIGNSIVSGVTFDVDPTMFRVGAGLEWLGFAFLATFIAYLYTDLSRHDDSWLPTAALIGGIATIALKLSTSAAWLVSATVRVGELSAEMDQTLDDIGGVGFKMTFFTFGLLLVAASASLLRSRLTARWIGWAGLLLGTANMATVNLDFDSEISVLPFLLSLLWLIVLSIALVVQQGRNATRSTR
jgi:hypothetical protein